MRCERVVVEADDRQIVRHGRLSGEGQLRAEFIGDHVVETQQDGGECLGPSSSILLLPRRNPGPILELGSSPPARLSA